ncbi:polysaccharide pyruvyl transferase family protein [Zavarzinia aquatilis]|uniref:Polysaccharide pyruvyl transferase family protein n=1 Tax=Zavarzinia aquatilis TaxID=2211142 RepID=A0A317E513_9PROT|nr:polysaccharide pyruvyl transferase family protein [Zavarzinia aquatilis]PWR21256.1 polysaccharide pyruvyl transferase family protein [Zavarzinia aquatilis]
MGWLDRLVRRQPASGMPGGRDAVSGNEESGSRAGPLRLAWAATNKQVTFANLGDAISPLIVSMVAGGRPVVHAHFRENGERLAAIGTIGHALAGGALHIWGAGSDRKLWPRDEAGQLTRPEGDIRVYATRGPMTRSLMLEAGIGDIPPVYGDPALLLPLLFDLKREPEYDLGIIPHFTELDGIGPQAHPLADNVRYGIPPEFQGRVRLLTTWTEPTPTALFDRMTEILSCRRIISRSLHGIVIAEAFGIPTIAMAAKGRGATACDLRGEGHGVDHRFVDYFLGTDRPDVTVYARRTSQATDWHDVMAAIDRFARPLEYDAKPLLDAFPWRAGPVGPLPVAALPRSIWEIRL